MIFYFYSYIFSMGSFKTLGNFYLIWSYFLQFQAFITVSHSFRGV